jgi:hypothetical protein
MMTLSNQKKDNVWSNTVTAKMEPNTRNTSMECKVMEADKKRFTHAMRNARNCKSPPGGSLRKHGARFVK